MNFEKSDRLFERATETIPLASQTFSKSVLQLPKGAAPLFLDRASGPRTWDPDGNEYLDFVNGLLCVTLGHGDRTVNAAIRDQLELGISLSLPTELEATLAEILVRQIPCAEMVRYGKNGSDATSAAIRIARAATGRNRVACCGYHGWHDWYIGSTARHLGVPSEVRDLTSPFPYNNPGALLDLLEDDPDGFAAVILEPTEYHEPENGFLEQLRETTERFGVVLVFDEMITGFRIDDGGAQAHYGVTPDLAAFGKGMANGMPISALVGRSDLMRQMENIFFSGTFGGEALSIAAAIATITRLKETNAVRHMTEYGAKLRCGVVNAIEATGLTEHFKVIGSNWWPRVTPAESNEFSSVFLSSIYRQEMLAAGLMHLASFNISFAHCEEDTMDETLERYRVGIGEVSEHLRSNNPLERLRGQMVKPVFQVRG
jgi:glutamate-1-semialdehyde 2,1-aminomutase